MRRIILIALVAVLGFFGYICVATGFENDTLDIEIFKLEDIQEASEDMSKELAAYDEINEKQYKAMNASINVAIKDYENTKAEYEDLVKTLGLDKETDTGVLVSTKKAYQIDFLFAIIGNYARAENSSQKDLDLDLIFVESSTKAPANSGYIYADLKFDVKGNYMKIADFIYDLEDDDRLGYEIRDFVMKEGHAVFVVYNVPIESSTLSQVSGSAQSNTGTTGGINVTLPSLDPSTMQGNNGTITTPSTPTGNTTNTGITNSTNTSNTTNTVN